MTTSTATKPRTRKPAAVKAKPVMETASPEQLTAAAGKILTESKPVPVRRRSKATVKADHEAVTPTVARVQAGLASTRTRTKRAAATKLAVVPEPVEVDVIAEAIQAMPDSFLQCRAGNHQWGGYNADYLPKMRVWQQTERCVNCTSTRKQFVNERTGELVKLPGGGSPDYVAGYLLPKGVGLGNRKGQFRLARIQRFSQQAQAQVRA